MRRDPQKELEKAATKLTRQVNNAISGWIWGSVVFVGLVVAVGVSLAIYIYTRDPNAPSTKKPTAATWDGKTTFTCKGNESVSISGVEATLTMTAILASGNCKLLVEGVTLTAPTVIEAKSNATITIKNSKLNGTTTSIDAQGNATVTLSETMVSGPSKKSSGATINGLAQ